LDRRGAITTLGALGLCAAASALAQQKGKLRRIGLHGSSRAQALPGSVEAFRGGMTALGWVDGRDYFLDARYADSLPEAIERNAIDLVNSRPDVLLAVGDLSTSAFSRRTKTIPIVFVISTDPIGMGFAASLHRPGGNMTGLTFLVSDLAAKRLELLREVSPRVAHVGVLFDPTDAQSASQVKSFEEAGQRLKMRVAPIEVRRAGDIETALRRNANPRLDAFAIAMGPLLSGASTAVSDGLVRLKLPSVTPSSHMAEAGMLMSYAPSITENFRLAAGFVDKILKGAKPGELPIEQPTKFELVVNARTARKIGVNVPRSVLLRADRVIE
jgi:putative ABC transport system substrate-binding protein